MHEPRDLVTFYAKDPALAALPRAWLDERDPGEVPSGSTRRLLVPPADAQARRTIYHGGTDDERASTPSSAASAASRAAGSDRWVAAAGRRQDPPRRGPRGGALHARQARRRRGHHPAGLHVGKGYRRSLAAVAYVSAQADAPHSRLRNRARAGDRCAASVAGAEFPAAPARRAAGRSFVRPTAATATACGAAGSEPAPSVRSGSWPGSGPSRFVTGKRPLTHGVHSREPDVAATLQGRTTSGGAVRGGARTPRRGSSRRRFFHLQITAARADVDEILRNKPTGAAAAATPGNRDTA